MSSTNEPISPPTPGPTSAGKTIAQIVAIVLAVSVVSYLVWDAQANAGQGLRQQKQPQAGGAPEGRPEASPPDSIPVDSNQGLLPSSKSLVINDAGTFSTEGSGVKLSDLEAGMLFSSKFAVLPFAKSGPPLRNEDETPVVTPKSIPKQAPKPGQAVVPTQTVGGNKD